MIDLRPDRLPVRTAAAELGVTADALLQAALRGDVVLSLPSHGLWFCQPAPDSSDLIFPQSKAHFYVIDEIPVPTMAIRQAIASKDGLSKFSRFELPGVQDGWFRLMHRDEIQDGKNADEMECQIGFYLEDLCLSAEEIRHIKGEVSNRPYECVHDPALGRGDQAWRDALRYWHDEAMAGLSAGSRQADPICHGEGAPTKRKRSGKQDDLAIELEIIFSEMKSSGERIVADTVMPKLKDRAGKLNSCISVAYSDGVIWKHGSSGGIEKHTMNMLTERIRRWEKKSAR